MHITLLDFGVGVWVYAVKTILKSWNGVQSNQVILKSSLYK